MDPIGSKESKRPINLLDVNPAPEAPEPEVIPLKQIRTFQGDIADALQRQNESLVSIQRSEHLRRGSVGSVDGTVSADSGNKKKFFLLFLGSLVLFALGGVGVWFTYNQYKANTSAPTIAAPSNRFLTPGSEINLVVATTTRDSLISSLSASLGGVPPGELRHVVMRKGSSETADLLPTSEFLGILESRAPGNLVRAFDPLFMFGSVGDSTFIIVKLVSFENAFAGMLLWEQTLAQDIGPLFATRELLRSLPPEAAFTDITDRNKDARILRTEGQDVLLYSFFDNNMLVITDNIETLRTLIDRLTREKLSR